MKSIAYLWRVEIIAYGDDFGWQATVCIETEREAPPLSWWEKIFGRDLLVELALTAPDVSYVRYTSANGISWEGTFSGVLLQEPLATKARRIVRHLKRVKRGVWKYGDPISPELVTGPFR